MISTGGNGTIALSWDAFGRLTAETGPFGTIGYRYDDAGRRTRLTWPDGFYVTYDYFDNGALAHIRENDAASGPGVLATFSYDGLGRRTRLDRGNGAATTYDYDGLGRLTGMHHLFTGGTGNVAWSFDHNPASGLRSATRDNNSYAWAGHYAVNRAYLTNGRNQYIAAGATGFGYDPNGNLVSDGTRGFEYNAENRLTVGYIGAAHQELIDDSMDRLYRYYDGAANRWLLYDGTDLIAEVDGNGATLRRYVHGLGEDEPLVWYEGAGTNDRHWLHADAQGSIVALSGANGALLSINRYDEYGIPGAGNVGRFQYTGQIWLAELGMSYYKARVYSPSLGRFLQTDPIGYADQFNLYEYVGDDPVNRIDPTGLWSPMVHETLFRNVLRGRFNETQIRAVIQTSYNQDRHNPGASNLAAHHLRAPGETAAHAMAAFNSFVNGKIAAGRQAHLQGNDNAARMHFAQAGHAVADAYSPMHRDANGDPRIYYSNVPTGSTIPPNALSDAILQSHSPWEGQGGEDMDALNRSGAQPAIQRRMAQIRDQIFGPPLGIVRTGSRIRIRQ